MANRNGWLLNLFREEPSTELSVGIPAIVTGPTPLSLAAAEKADFLPARLVTAFKPGVSSIDTKKSALLNTYFLLYTSLQHQYIACGFS